MVAFVEEIFSLSFEQVERSNLSKKLSSFSALDRQNFYYQNRNNFPQSREHLRIDTLI